MKNLRPFAILSKLIVVGSLLASVPAFAADAEFKPRPETYQGVARLLRLPPEHVMLVASHAYDLRAAQSAGLRTAFVHRPLEYGPDHPRQEPDPSFDLVVNDVLELSERL